MLLELLDKSGIIKETKEKEQKKQDKLLKRNDHELFKYLNYKYMYNRYVI